MISVGVLVLYGVRVNIFSGLEMDYSESGVVCVAFLLIGNNVSILQYRGGGDAPIIVRVINLLFIY